MLANLRVIGVIFMGTFLFLFFSEQREKPATAKATTTYVAPASSTAGSTSPVLQPGVATPAGPGLNPAQYPPQQQQAQAGAVPVANSQQVLPNPVLPQAVSQFIHLTI